MDYKFDWDDSKAKSNLAKHKISFEIALMAFKDENAISIYDEEHSETEDRWITIRVGFMHDKNHKCKTSNKKRAFSLHWR